MLVYLAVGRKYGVSDNAIRKWVRAYERERVREMSDEPERAPPLAAQWGFQCDRWLPAAVGEPAAVNRDLAAGDERGGVRGQEGHDAGDLAGSA